MSCQLCESQRGKGTLWKDIDTRCDECGKDVKCILDLHHTNKHLCSLDCEAKYWLDIIY